MGAAARALARAPLIKIKVDRSDPETQIRTVRNAAPAPRVIVDPTESWTFADVERLQTLLAELRIDLLAQPLPARRASRRSTSAKRSEANTSELQLLIRISYAVFVLKQKKKQQI